ncbi:MAG: PHP domain-containing protein [Lachnospirales bacterium]
MTYTCDLHTHTSFSDGTLSPSDLIKLAYKKNIKAVSITDHDTITGIYEGREEAKKLGVNFINGIELSCLTADNIELHILGYDFDIDDNFKNGIAMAVEQRAIRNKKIIKLMNNANINIPFDFLETFPNQSIVTRAHFAKFLIENGYAKDKNDAFSKYLTRGCKTYVPKQYISPKECIDILHKSKGVSVLAHPTLYGLGKGEIEKLVLFLKDLGLDGIEVVHSTYSSEQEKFLRKIANKYNLLQTGGSDFHGAIKKNLELGTGYGSLHIPYSIYEDIINYKKNL